MNILTSIIYAMRSGQLRRISFLGLVLVILAVSASLMHDFNSFPRTAAAAALPVCDEGYVIINTNTTWTAGCVHVTDGIVVEAGATLTLAPGAIVKFRSLTGIFVGHTPGAQAALVAHGTAAQPIVLTSYKDDDDASGGDSNGDLAATSAAPGDWRGIVVGPPPVANPLIDLDHVVARYGGQCGEALVGNIYNTCATTIPNPTAIITVNHSAIEHGAAAGLEFQDGGNLNVSNTSILNHGTYGVKGGTAADHIEAFGNWWGDPSGPASDLQPCNPATGSGELVSCYVDFGSWLAGPPQPSSAEQPGTTPRPVEVGGIVGLVGGDAAPAQAAPSGDASRLPLAAVLGFLGALALAGPALYLRRRDSRN